MIRRLRNRLAPDPAEQLFHWSIIAAGLFVLIWLILSFPFQLAWLGFGALIALFIAVQVNFPLFLKKNEIFLIPVSSLGAGLLFGAHTAAWATSLGIAIGFIFRFRWPSSIARRLEIPSTRWPEALFVLGQQNLTLILALATTGFASQGLVQIQATAGHEVEVGLFLPLIMFAVLHGGLYSLEALLHHKADELNRHDLPYIWLVELIPIPIVWTAVISFSAIGVSALVVIGSAPVIVAILGQEILRVRKDLERRILELSTLNRVSQLLRSSLELDSLLSVIQTQVSQLMNVDNFYVALLDTDNRRIWYPLAVKQGLRQAWPARPLAGRLTDQVILESKPLLIQLDPASPNVKLELPPSEVTPVAWIGVPLVASNRAIGCLALFSIEHEFEFQQSDVDLLTIFSGQISVAIENALLFDQAHRRTTQLETLNRISNLITASLDPQEVLAQVCSSVTQVSNQARSAIFLLDTDNSQVWMAYAHQLSQDFVQQNQTFSIADNDRTRCLRTGHPVLTPSIHEAPLAIEFAAALQSEDIQAFGDFPLITPEGQIGFLSVYFNQEHVFEIEETDLLQTFAAQAALAVSNARLHARTDLALSKRANQLSILEAVGRELAAAMHSERLFKMILDYAIDTTGSPWGSIGLYNANKRTIEIKASHGYPTPIHDFSVERGIAGRAVRTRQVVECSDVCLDADYVDLTGGAARSQLSVPLVYKGRVLGVLSLEHAQFNGYSPSDQAFITQLANQASIALINAELYKETQRRLHEQTMLYHVSTRLAGKLELESILQIILQAMQSAAQPAQVGLYLWNNIAQAYEYQNESILQAAAARPLPDWQEETRPNHQVKTAKVRTLQGYEQFPETLLLNDLSPYEQALLDNEPIRFQKIDRPPPALSDCKGCNLWLFPLTINQQRLGLIAVVQPAHLSEELQEQDLQFLRAIVPQGAISIQNALLFSDATHGRDRLTGVLNSVREGIVMIEADGHIMLANDSVREMTGLDPAELNGRRLVELPAQVLQYFDYTPQEAQELVDAIGLGRVPATQKTTLKVPGVRPEKVLERVTLPVWGRQGKAIGWMLVLRDVTEEYQISQAREMLTETLIHDLRSPLSAVIGALDVMEEDLTPDTSLHDISSQALEVARRSSRRLLGMVESLLDISRMQSGTMEIHMVSCNLQEQLAGILSDIIPQANEFGIILHNHVQADLPAVLADPSKLARVLLNLLDNALKFTPSGGQVSISAELFSTDMLAVKISDSGPGIPKDFQEKIFERFTQIPGQRGRRRGSGLGLTFCKLAVEAHGGTIWVEPRPEGGSIFTFTLPVVQAPKG